MHEALHSPVFHVLRVAQTPKHRAKVSLPPAGANSNNSNSTRKVSFMHYFREDDKEFSSLPVV